MEWHDIHFADLNEYLPDLFGIGNVEVIRLLYSGYKCLNYEVVANGKRYFLKQYRYRLSHNVHDIKKSEQHFSKHGLPVVLPLKDKYGRGIFRCHGHWYSLFPYITEGIKPKYGELSDDTIISLAQTLAHAHKIGSKKLTHTFRPIRLWNKERYLWELVEIERGLERMRSEKKFIDPIILKTLQLKTEFVKNNNIKPTDIPLASDCLLHGDLIFQNTFIEEGGKISYLFDFEKTCMGPRAYEVARGAILNCLGEVWGKDDIDCAKKYVEAYRAEFPMDYSEFRNGMFMFLINSAHKLWFDANIILSGDYKISDIYRSHAFRMDRINDDWEELCQSLYA